MNSPRMGPVASRVVPCGLAFIASFCIMVVELVAGRMIARHVGSSLHTWTSVIGVVLGGITLGNLLGGRLADWFNTRKTLGVLFLLAAVAASLIPVLNKEVGGWTWLVHRESWPLRIALHVTCVFLLPSTVLGLIGPVVAKMALDQGLSTGRTVGNVYAWGALGSIAGTFMTGFYLVAVLGATTVIYGVAAVLAVVGIGLLPFFAWPFATACLLASFLFLGGWQFCNAQLEWDPDGGWLAVREKTTEGIIYADESQYSYIQVGLADPDPDVPTGTLELVLDHLVHSYYVPDDPQHLAYGYERIYAAVTDRSQADRPPPRTLFLGGGGYVFPRYIASRWPGSRIEVAEIDPGVTRAVMTAMGLREDEARIVGGPSSPAPIGGGISGAEGISGGQGTSGGEGGAPAGSAVGHPIEIHHLDARNHVDDLIRRKRRGEGFEPFDFVYGDAFNHYAVPFHLVTLEFTRSIRDLLREGSGVYMLNVIDIYASGRFLGAVYQTFRRVFPTTHVIVTNRGGPSEGEWQRDTFVVIGSFGDLDLRDFDAAAGNLAWEASVLGEGHLLALQERSRGIVLTDDYSPVENLLEPVVRHNDVGGTDDEDEEDEEQNEPNEQDEGTGEDDPLGDALDDRGDDALDDAMDDALDDLMDDEADGQGGHGERDGDEHDEGAGALGKEAAAESNPGTDASKG